MNAANSETSSRPGDSASIEKPMGRLFAVIPAAGESRRMGRPKLLLPLGGRTVLARLLDALRPEVECAVVVIRPDDAALAQEAEANGAVVVRPDIPPPDMRTSVEHALEWLRLDRSPTPNDAWLLIPADHPVIEPSVVQAVAEAWRGGNGPIIVPTHDGRRGHPTLFVWPLADEVGSLPPGAGLNQLVRRDPSCVGEVQVSSATALFDLDTPDDYAALLRQFED